MRWRRIVVLRAADGLQLGMAVPHPRPVATNRRTRQRLVLQRLEDRIALIAHLLGTWILAVRQFLYDFLTRYMNHVLASTHTTFDFRLRKKVAQTTEIASQSTHS